MREADMSESKVCAACRKENGSAFDPARCTSCLEFHRDEDKGNLCMLGGVDAQGAVRRIVVDETGHVVTSDQAAAVAALKSELAIAHANEKSYIDALEAARAKIRDLEQHPRYVATCKIEQGDAVRCVEKPSNNAPNVTNCPYQGNRSACEFVAALDGAVLKAKAERDAALAERDTSLHNVGTLVDELRAALCERDDYKRLNGQKVQWRNEDHALIESLRANIRDKDRELEKLRSLKVTIARCIEEGVA